MTRKKILFIEDDLDLAVPLKEFFEDHGFEVFVSTTGEEGLALYNEKKPDLILLDIILPDKNGFDIISTIRDKDLTTPAILITGTEFNDENQIRAYELGSLNFMPKPILPQAVLALIQHVLSVPKELKSYKIGAYETQLQSQTLTISSDKHNLREKDAKLMEFLLERKDLVISRQVLLKQIWYTDDYKYNNLLDGAIYRVRQLLKDYPGIVIKNVYGSGYMLKSLS